MFTLPLSGLPSQALCPVQQPEVWPPSNPARWQMVGGRCQVADARWHVPGGRCQVADARWQMPGGPLPALAEDSLPSFARAPLFHETGQKSRP